MDTTLASLTRSFFHLIQFLFLIVKPFFPLNYVSSGPISNFIRHATELASIYTIDYPLKHKKSALSSKEFSALNIITIFQKLSLIGPSFLMRLCRSSPCEDFCLMTPVFQNSTMCGQLLPQCGICIHTSFTYSSMLFGFVSCFRLCIMLFPVHSHFCCV